jgi:hypothetical protein
MKSMLKRKGVKELRKYGEWNDERRRIKYGKCSRKGNKNEKGAKENCEQRTGDEKKQAKENHLKQKTNNEGEGMEEGENKNKELRREYEREKLTKEREWK